jgi:hypothetical protein
MCHESTEGVLGCADVLIIQHARQRGVGSQIYNLAALPPGGGAPVPITEKPAWAPELIGMRAEKTKLSSHRGS